MNVGIAIRKVLKVIRMFEKEVTLIGEDGLILDKGKPIKNTSENTVRMAIMTFNSASMIPSDTFNSNSYFEDKKEAYYIITDENINICTNMKVITDDVVYRINKIEENYNSFLRMELVIDDKRN